MKRPSRPRSRWITRRCGCAYWTHSRRKLCIHDVRKIRRKWVKGNGVVLARQFHVTQPQISRIVNLKRWRVAA